MYYLSCLPAAANMLPSSTSSTSMTSLATLYDASNAKSKKSGQIKQAINQAIKHFDSMTTTAQRAAVVKIFN